MIWSERRAADKDPALRPFGSINSCVRIIQDDDTLRDPPLSLLFLSYEVTKPDPLLVASHDSFCGEHIKEIPLFQTG